MKMKQQRRSDCPISVALETIGDTWSLLIIRDIVYFGKKTYGEFLASPEKMATNILANRLFLLEQKQILIRESMGNRKGRESFRLTEKGLALIPIVLEMAAWGGTYDSDTGAPQAWLKIVRKDREKVLRLIYQTVRNGGSIFVGKNRVVDKLGLKL